MSGLIAETFGIAVGLAETGILLRLGVLAVIIVKVLVKVLVKVRVNIRVKVLIKVLIKTDASKRLTSRIGVKN